MAQPERDVDNLKADKAARLERIQKKKEYLNELEVQTRLYKNLMDRNTRNPADETAERVQLPFIVIHTKQDTGNFVAFRVECGIL